MRRILIPPRTAMRAGLQLGRMTMPESRDSKFQFQALLSQLMADRGSRDPRAQCCLLTNRPCSATGCSRNSQSFVRPKMRQPGRINTLTTADGQEVEAKFRGKLLHLTEEGPAKRTQRGCGEARNGLAQEPLKDQPASETSTGEDPTTLIEEPDAGQRRGPVAKTIRLRDKDHRRFVSTQACLVCGRRPTDPHHLRFAQPRALDARSATSSRSRCAASIIMSCIAAGTKRRGGATSTSIPCRSRWRYGAARIRRRTDR
jgi:hypothetical protein